MCCFYHTTTYTTVYLSVFHLSLSLSLSLTLFLSLFFSGLPAYTMAKYGMSLCVLGMAEEFKSEGVAVNALWPRTGIDDICSNDYNRRHFPHSFCQPLPLIVITIIMHVKQ